MANEDVPKKPETEIILAKAKSALQQQDPQKAARILNPVLEFDPTNKMAHHFMAIATLQANDPENALKHNQRALDLDVDFFEALHLQGILLRRLGALNDALDHFRRALELKPDDAAILSNFGAALRQAGQLDEATDVLERAVAVAPDLAEAHANLAAAYLECNRLQKAEESVQVALTLKPKLAEAHFAKGRIHSQKAESEPALQSFFLAFNLKNSAQHRKGLVQALSAHTFREYSDNWQATVLRLLEDEGVSPRRLAIPAFSLLRHSPGYKEFLVIALDPSKQDFSDLAETISNNDLLLKILASIPIRTTLEEQAFTKLRRSLLMHINTGHGLGGNKKLAIALSEQCYLNEYIFNISSDEVSITASLFDDVREAIQNGVQIDPDKLVLLGCYSELSKLRLSLDSFAIDPDMESMIREQIAAPRLEEQIKGEIGSLMATAKESAAVQTHYEENPYPRWTRVQQSQLPDHIDDHLKHRQSIQGKRPKVLIAGCGTGQQVVMHSAAYKNAETLAVDLSLQSLAYAKRKANEAGMTDVEFAQADIVMLGELERRFDIIESVGVLHHLEHPHIGLKSLSLLLEGDGFMLVGLYSRLAR